MSLFDDELEGILMKHPYQPEVPMMTFQATPNELIAVGAVITQYLTQSERTPNKTKDQLELMALLHSFQGRLVSNAQHQPPVPSGLRKVRR
jgi:hypothetical protein